MKSILELLLRSPAAAGAIAVAGLLAGCGQKGPLYLPKAKPAQTLATPPVSPAPVVPRAPIEPMEAPSEESAPPVVK